MSVEVGQRMVHDGTATLVRGRTLQVRWLGKVPYTEAFDLQTALFDRSTDDYALFLEHPHVFTMGVRARPEHVLVDANNIGADIVPVNRGGDVTYHGPGQLVGYFIQDVGGRGGLTDTAKYVCGLEQLIIDSLEDLGLPGAGRLRGQPGVWIGENKIAAVGVRITRGRTMHGFALNVTTDLSWFDKIVPCGIPDKGVTSLAALGIDADMHTVVDTMSARLTSMLASRSLSEFSADRSSAPTVLSAPCSVGELSADRSGMASGDGFGKWTAVERHDLAWKVTTKDLSAFTRGEGPGETPAGTKNIGPSCGPGSRTSMSAPSSPSELSADRSSLPAVLLAQTSPSESSAAMLEGGGAKQPVKKQPVRLLGRLKEAGVDNDKSIGDNARKPEWMKVKANFGPEYMRLKKTMKSLDLVTVCEEAGCPNIFDCWNDGTATFMINGERCTRACGFCLVDTRKPEALDPTEPQRVAEAIATMKLQHAVITVVARDDLEDGGAGAVAQTIKAVHERCAQTAVEVLISDCKGNRNALQQIFDARPEVLNHNLETVVRLQRAVRPSAGYARSLTVLARAKQQGLTTKSGLIVGMGETQEEVVAAMRDLRNVGVDILTVGQYLRPTSNHMPMARWWTPEEFEQLKQAGDAMGFAHVEASPLTRSSYHAKQGAQAAAKSPETTTATASFA
jgi:lipoic acid synthetase